jgi:soluble lytic murein transglycosylase-like protein
MELPSDVAAVVRRISQIAAEPAIDMASFNSIVQRAGAVSRSAIDREVEQDSQTAGLDPKLVEAIIATESAFDPDATSPSGARGLMQLMPQTAAALGINDPYDPAQNVRGGTRYLRSLLDRFGNVELAIAAYNAGPGAVERFGGLPPYAETRAYVRTVLTRYGELRTPRAVLKSAKP